MNKDINDFFNVDMERDIWILLSHYRHHEWLGQEYADILNSVFVGSIVKGRLFLSMLGIKADKQNNTTSLHNEEKGNITAKTLDGRFAESTDFKNGEREMLYRLLTSVNKAEVHRDGYDETNDEIIHPSILAILRLIDDCIYEHSGRKIKYEYAQQLLKHIKK
ncbi:MAG: hypothetical protein ABII90_14980 [Bacteroidota bacterium]